MSEFDLVMLAGGPHPGCRVHIDERFPSAYAVQLMAGGSFYFQRAGHARVETTAPTFFWTDRVSRYRYGPGPTGAWEHNWVMFRGALADDYYKPLLEHLAPSGAVRLSGAARTREAFDELYRSLRSPDLEWQGVFTLNRLLAYVEQDRSTRGPDAALLAVKDAIDQEPERRHDFHALAEACGYSYSRFRRLFRERFAAPPQDYLIRRRMKRAAELLSMTRDGVQEVGYALGYADPARFSKVFKQHFGLSPSDYRRSLQATGG
ncbi:MAG: AraC family transcriptional regulator [Planctomycetota bacterium]